MCSSWQKRLSSKVSLRKPIPQQKNTAASICADVVNCSATCVDHAHICQDIWFQLDEAPEFSTTVVLNYQNQIFRARWSSRVGPIAWPPRSSDLSLLKFFCWGYMKYNVYETLVDCKMNLVA
ncbi:hypothetical protein TNCV_2004031 [Trichonephila clavipes]|nr:hypothetical protein TNCV_2004031 [Trichonephila clavipes]